MKKLAIVTTHPIQYNAPWFKLLTMRGKVAVKVFYTWSQTEENVKDKGFGRTIEWDIPLLEGYDYEFVENISKDPGSHHFAGIDCPSLNMKLETFEPDVILFFGWNFKSHIKAIRYFHGKTPVWFRGDSTLLDQSSNLRSILRKLALKQVYKKVDAALYVGEANKDYFLAYGMKSDQLIHAPHAIDNKRFENAQDLDYNQEAEQWRSELGLASDDVAIVFVGKFESKKQPDFLLNAFNEVIKNGKKNLKLVFVGNGALEQELKEKAGKNVFFLPFQNQSKMPVVYRLGNVICLPSKGPGETWGLAVNEAMACGKPVIVSNKVGCHQDLVLNRSTGYVFQYNDQHELESILKKLNSSELQQLGSNAKSLIQNYSFEHIVEAIEDYI